MKNPNKRLTLIENVRNFLIDWHQFPIDFWWRKNYNVPFGSKAHREMNLIDMSIDYIERLDMIKYQNAENDDDMFEEKDERVVSMTQQEIDEDFDNIDLEKL